MYCNLLDPSLSLCNLKMVLPVLFQAFGMEPLDVAAHLKIVGESLSIIGMKLQEHRVRP